MILQAADDPGKPARRSKTLRRSPPMKLIKPEYLIKPERPCCLRRRAFVRRRVLAGTVPQGFHLFEGRSRPSGTELDRAGRRPPVTTDWWAPSVMADLVGENGHSALRGSARDRAGPRRQSIGRALMFKTSILPRSLATTSCCWRRRRLLQEISGSSRRRRTASSCRANQTRPPASGPAEGQCPGRIAGRFATLHGAAGHCRRQSRQARAAQSPRR